jgi:hypothetical protein
MATTVETSNAVTNITVTTGTQNVFSNIATDSGTVVVDSTVDTLTFTGAGGITTSGTPGTDTITITQGAADISSKDTDDLSEGSTNLYYTDARVTTKLGTVSSHILPDTDDTYDLGSPTKQFRELYLGPDSLYIDGVQLISRQAANYDFTTDAGQSIRLKPEDSLFLEPTSGNVRVSSGNLNVEGTGDINVTTGDINITNGGVTAASGTVSADTVLTDLVKDTADLVLESGAESFIHANTGNLYVGSLSQAVHITGTEVKGVGTNPNITANNLTVNGTVTGIDVSDLTDTGGLLAGDDLSNNDTDDLSEGSTNLYFTNARADARVNLQTGANLDLSNKSTSDLAEGTNLYYTDSRFDTRLATKDTGDLTEGTNLYYTTGRFDTAFSGKSTTDLSEGTNLYYTDSRFDTRLGTKTTDNLTEGSSNLYYTDARAQAVSINNLSEDTTPELGGTLDILGNDITSSTANVVISADGTDKDVIIKVKDAGATLQTAGTFSDYDYIENTTNADSGTATTRYDTVLDIDRGIRIGSTANEFSSTGASPNNNNSAYNLSGIIVGNTGNTWPAIDIISNGQATDGSNPLRNQLGDSVAGGLFTQFPNGQLNFKASNGTIGSIEALGSGKRMGQINFYGHDTAGYGGSGAVPSIAITGSANETFSTSNSRGGKFEIEILPTGGAATDGDGSSDRRHIFTAVSDSVKIGDHSNDNKYIIVDTANSELFLNDIRLDLGSQGRIRADSDTDIRLDPQGTGIVRIDTAVRLDNQSGDPSGSGDASHIYAKDDSGSSEVFVRDEAGNVTKISPHNEQGEWEYLSRNIKTGKTVRVNMEAMIRDIEQLTGKTYIENE